MPFLKNSNSLPNVVPDARMELFANPGELEAYPVNMFSLTQQIGAIIPATQRIMAVMFHMRGLVEN